MSVPVALDKNTVYATKPNIGYPGTQTQATAAETLAQTRINDQLASSGLDGLAITVSAGAIEVQA